MSYGVNDMRDGVNLSCTRPLVMPTEVMNLPNLTGYLQFGRDLPVVRFRDRYLKGEMVATAFVACFGKSRTVISLNRGQAFQ